jgi:tricorn protease
MRRTLFTLPAVVAICLTASWASAGEIKLARHPDYHNGQIVFSYLGDLWKVNEDGSNPQRLTVHNARDVHPRFSPDGKLIAFSSNRDGNYDVFVMPAEGGKPKQLTFHAAGDTVVGWSRDGKRVIFSSARGRVFPGIPSLYDVPVDGGLEQPLPTDWGWTASYSPDGRKLAFNRHPLPYTRKHYRGSYAADLWVMDLASKSFRRLVDDTLTDALRPNNFWPMYGNGFVYFVSDRDVMAKAGSGQVMTSTNNIWKVAEDGGAPVQVTKHTSGNLFWPSLSSDGRVIVYEENFGIWKLDVNSGETREIKINLVSDDKDNVLEAVTSNSECDAYSLSPSGKRAVISTHGELFTIATDRGDVRRITSTPSAREVQPVWSPDGKWIAFVGDQSGRDEIWLCDEFGKQLRKVSDGDSQKGTPVWSPDSQQLLYAASDRKLYKYALGSGQTSVVTSGEQTGFGGLAIMSPQWSPDGKFISYTKTGLNLLPHVYIIGADGGQERRVTDEDSYSDSNAQWTPDGKKLVYLSGQDTGNIGSSNRALTAQIYSVSLTREDKEPADRSIDSEEDAVRIEKEQRKDLRNRFTRQTGEGDDPERVAPVVPREPPKVTVKIDFDRMARRARQLTRSGDTIGTMAVSPDSRTLVFTTMGTEGGRPVQSIWSVGLDGDRLTRLTQSGQTSEGGEEQPRFRGLFGGGFNSLQFTRDGRSLYYRQGSGIYALTLGGGLGDRTGGERDGATPSATPGRGRPTDGAPAGLTAGRGAAGAGTARRVNFTARVEVDHRQERRQVFNESWRVMKHRFYDPSMHGVDWDRVKTVYEPLLEHCGDQEDMHEVVSMMIGELNASHTGISGGGRRGRGGREEAGANTRHPGFDLEPDASGFYKVTHVYKNGPADKDYVRISVGDYVLAVDGHDLKAGDNYWQYFTKAPGGRFEFTLNNKPSPEGAWRTKVAPISVMALGNLQYERWVDERRKKVDELSGGTVGYLHIRQMNEQSLRQFERDLGRLSTKKALIIDQRFNPGGNIDQELLQILGQRQYQYTRVRDAAQVTRPLRGFFGPMVVMQNERSTSDAEVFPDGFRTLKLGKIVGMTTYGAVIGTGAYQLMDGSSIRTPGSGLWNVSGQNLENYGVPPDVYVDNTPEDFLKGRDAQLERAVAVLKEEMNGRTK